MIRADVKSAGAAPVIEPLEELYRHPVIPIAKLQGADDDMDQGRGQQAGEDKESRLGCGQDERGEEIDDQPGHH